MEATINSLEDKIVQLISRYEAVAADNAELREKVASFERLISDKDDKIKELTQQLDNLQLREAFQGSSGGSSEAGKKVALLIKEIDKCLLMLND